MTDSSVQTNDQLVHPFTKNNLIGFSGRMNRLDYAILFFSIFLLDWGLMKYFDLNPILISIQAYTDPTSLSQQASTFGLLLFLSTIAKAYISVKRFQDINYEGYFASIFLLALLPLGFLSLILAFVIFVLKMILFFAPGNPTDNKFGPPPTKNHRNKLLLLLVVMFLVFMIYSSFIEEARPTMEAFIEETMANSS